MRLVNQPAARTLAVGVGLVAGAARARRWYLRWGATGDEVSAVLPGDELLPHADLTATRAVTVRAPAADVWPWIAQLGQGRGGLYSYDWMENLVGCDIRSADRIVAEWQCIGAGDAVHLHPEVALNVAAVEQGRALVLRGAVQMGPVPAPYDFTWAFVLGDHSGGTTRLVVRERYEYLRWWSFFLLEPVECISFVMSRQMLRGIRARAEKYTRQGAPVNAVDGVKQADPIVI